MMDISYQILVGKNNLPMAAYWLSDEIAVVGGEFLYNVNTKDKLLFSMPENVSVRYCHWSIDANNMNMYYQIDNALYRYNIELSENEIICVTDEKHNKQRTFHGYTVVLNDGSVLFTSEDRNLYHFFPEDNKIEYVASYITYIGLSEDKKYLTLAYGSETSYVDVSTYIIDILDSEKIISFGGNIFAINPSSNILFYVEDDFIYLFDLDNRLSIEQDKLATFGDKFEYIRVFYDSGYFYMYTLGREQDKSKLYSLYRLNP